MMFKPQALLLSLPLYLAGAAAQASDFFCNNYVAGAPLAHFQCVQTVVGPGAPLLIAPDQAGAGPLTAASVSAGSGPFASTASASASAEPGLLRGFTSAEMLGGSIPDAQAVARADAWSADSGTVVGALGVAVGTPVMLRFTVDVGGSFGGGGVFTALSEATVDFVARGPNGAFIHTGTQADKFNPIRFATIDISALVGDTFEMLTKLHVAAGAINNGVAANAMSVADVTNTSHLYIDVLSANADVIGASGHFYASDAVALSPVPEPSQTALLFGGLAMLGAFVRRRAR
jgi:hypothetical protein